MAGISQEQYEAASDLLHDHVLRTLARAPVGSRFTTIQFVEALRRDPDAEQAYQRAAGILADSPEWSHAAAQVLHGQVIPQILRSCSGVRFGGFAHDVPSDGTAVSVYWRKES